MTIYFDKINIENIKKLSIAVLKHIEKLDLQDREKFCNLSSSMLNNKFAKPYWVAAAICKHYIIDKQEKIYIICNIPKKKQLQAKHIIQINSFDKYKKLGKLISKII